MATRAAGGTAVEARRTGGLSLTGFFKELVHQFQHDQVTGLAQRVAYNLIFAIPPLLVLIVALAGLLNNVFSVPVVENLRSAITDHAPGSMQQVLTQLVDHAVSQAGTGAISVGLALSVILALYGAGGGIGALIAAFNRTYEIEDGRSIVRRYGLQIGLTLLVGLGMVLAFVALVFGRRIGDWIAGLVGLGHLFSTLWNIFLWPAAVLLVVLLLALLYYTAPNVRQSFRWVWPGAIAAAILWLAAIFGFRLYLAVGSPGSAYGALGSVIVFLFFLYITGIIFIVGVEINAVLQEHYDPTLIRFLAERQHQPPPVHDEVYQRARAMGLLGPEHHPVAALPGRAATAAGPEPQNPSKPKRRTSSWLTKLAALGLVAAALAGEMIFGKRRRKPKNP
ncbi:MAG TPA: YihY/virulence factor BrkB family protein [Thermomicrobiaceae bacterium]|nr:YihY/virulence factor BrkB family protein [Thermomicrobiaceae bacterium]